MATTNDGDYDIIRWFEDVSENAGSVQVQTLYKILQENHGVEYLQKWFGGTNIQEMEPSALQSLYTSVVPLVSHADLEPYIQRIVDGDTAPLLTQQPINTMSLSSGTTDGRQKYVPFTHHSSHTTLQIFRLATAYRSRFYPIKEGGRILELIYSSKQSKTKGGLSVGTATTHYYASEEFKIKQEKTKSFTCSPQEVISSGDYNQSTYCHLLLGLFFSNEVEFITSTFAYSIVQAFRAFEEQWRDMCNDIRQGTLGSIITIPRMRNAVLKIISTNPNPALASRIELCCEELEGVGWCGMVPKLWPNAKYVYSILTGSMQHYLHKLRHYACGVALVSADYGSTESWIGVNVDPCLPPRDVTFAVIPSFSYFEFIPLHRHNKGCSEMVSDGFMEDEAVPLSQVKVGQEYEIVLTTFTGLYRYRLGDVVQVAGFHNNTPKLNFIFRRKLILTINIDKNTEKDLQLVVDKASNLLTSACRAELVDFSSHAHVASHPGHYVIFWEVNGDHVEDSVLQECCTEMDRSFLDYGYVVSRRTSSIGPLELCIVERGTFRKVLDHYIAKGGTLSQFKTPRCISDPFVLRILLESTVKRVHSSAYN